MDLASGRDFYAGSALVSVDVPMFIPGRLFHRAGPLLLAGHARQ